MKIDDLLARNLDLDEAAEAIIEILSRTSRQETVRRWQADSQRGKPQKYKINVLSMGGVGLEIAKILATTENRPLSQQVEQINLCHRVMDRVQGGKDVKAYDLERDLVAVDPTHTQAFLLRQIGLHRRKRVREHPYEQLDDLAEILTDYPDSNPLGSITIVCGRYRFDYTGDISDRVLHSKRKGTAKNLEEVNAILRQRSNIRSTFFPAPQSEQELQQRHQEVLSVNSKLDEIAARAQQEYGIAENRIYNLKENFIGVRELGRFLQEIDYQGMVIMVSNPLDLMTNLLCRTYGLENHRRVVGAADNDRTRAILALMEELEPPYQFSHADVPVIGTHDEFQVWAVANSRFYGKDPRNGERIDGRSFLELGGNTEMVQNAHEFAAKHFPFKEFALLKTTAHDTAPGIVNIIESIIRDAEGQAVRVSSYEPMNGSVVWIGGPTQFELSKEYRRESLSDYELTEENKRTLAQGIRTQAAIIDMLTRAGLLAEVKGAVKDRVISIPQELQPAQEPLVVVVKERVEVPTPSPIPSVTPEPDTTRLLVASGRDVIELDGNLEEIARYSLEIL